jgi:hypothetical protein
MKVYAVVGFVAYEGCSEPEAIYASEARAKAACAELNHASCLEEYTVFEYELQE